MQLGDTAQPHDGLRISNGRTWLRPLGRRPVLLQRYCCRICSTNWLLERDPLQPEHPDWVCLYQASSILDPVSAAHQGIHPSIHPATAERTDAARGTMPEQLRHSHYLNTLP
ncbi:conserved hypothetical protein [Burkholderia sp. H160]|nr:conserved hypothetical protein [Burkholderia sp. H160]